MVDWRPSPKSRRRKTLAAIRSERLLCREVQVNLAYRWFCGLSIEDKIPNYSAFSRARNERFRNSDTSAATLSVLLRHVLRLG
jgi:transposase